MGSVLRFLCVLSVLISTGSSLSCTKCMKMGESNCEGPSVTCSPDEACGAGRIIASSVPDDSYKPNGLKCRVCFSPNSDWCSSTTTIDCEGDENMCILQSTQIKDSREETVLGRILSPSYQIPEKSTVQLQGPVTSLTAVRGCATKSICDYGGRSAIVAGISLNVTMLCTATKYF